MIRSRVARWLCRLLGAVSLMGALVVAVAGGGAAMALGLLAFGVAMLAGAWSRPPPPGSLDGVRTVDGGTSFARSRTVVRSALLGTGCYAVASAAFGISAEGSGDRLKWAAATAGLLGIAALGYRAQRGHSDVLLTPRSVVQRTGRRTVVVPWTAIARVERIDFSATEILSIRLGEDRDGVVLPGVSRLLRSSDVSVWLNSLRADSRVFAELVAHMVDHPDDRPTLARPDAVARAFADRDRRTSPSAG